MVEVEFNFNEIKTINQCNINEKMNDILNKYIIRIGKNINDIYFVYNDCIIKDNLKDITLNDFANSIDKNRKKINLLVYKRNINKEKNNIIKLNEIIYCKCGEKIRIIIK